jgi:hypothetical protein
MRNYADSTRQVFDLFTIPTHLYIHIYIYIYIYIPTRTSHAVCIRLLSTENTQEWYIDRGWSFQLQLGPSQTKVNCTVSTCEMIKSMFVCPSMERTRDQNIPAHMSSHWYINVWIWPSEHVRLRIWRHTVMLSIHTCISSAPGLLKVWA